MLHEPRHQKVEANVGERGSWTGTALRHDPFSTIRVQLKPGILVQVMQEQPKRCWNILRIVVTSLSKDHGPVEEDQIPGHQRSA